MNECNLSPQKDRQSRTVHSSSIRTSIFFLILHHANPVTMDVRLWEPERIANIASVYRRVSPYLQTSDRIRTGMEGDECSNPLDAKCGTVLDVSRSDDGEISFRAVLDDDQVVTLNNRDVVRTWEVEPSFLEHTFRARVADALTPEHEDAEMSISRPDARDDDDAFAQYRNAMHSEFDSVNARVDDIETKIRALALHLSRDILHVKQNEPLEFSYRYVDRHDSSGFEDTVPDTRDAAPDTRHDDEYRKVDDGRHNHTNDDEYRKVDDGRHNHANDDEYRKVDDGRHNHTNDDEYRKVDDEGRHTSRHDKTSRGVADKVTPLAYKNFSEASISDA